MPEKLPGELFVGGPTQEGRESRVAEARWHKHARAIQQKAAEGVGRMFDGVRQLTRVDRELAEWAKTDRGLSPERRSHLQEFEQRRNDARDSFQDAEPILFPEKYQERWEEQLKAAGDDDMEKRRLEDELYVAIEASKLLGDQRWLYQEQYSKDYDRLLRQINRLIEAEEEAIREAEKVTLHERTLLDTFRNAPPPPPPPTKKEFDMSATQRFEVPQPPPPPSFDDDATQKFRPADAEAAPTMNFEEYEKAVRNISVELLQVSGTLRENEGDANVREWAQGEVDRLDARLKELERDAGSPDSEVRQDVENVVDGIRLLLEEPRVPQAAQAAVSRARVPKGSSFVAWMPRVPEPPYARKAVATLAVAPPPPPAPVAETPATLNEEEGLERLEQALTEFNEEKDRILAQHKSVVDEILQRIRERKLQALRESLNTEA